jgi:hypothetical protein
MFLSARKTRFCAVTTEYQVASDTVKQLNAIPLLLYRMSSIYCDKQQFIFCTILFITNADERIFFLSLSLSLFTMAPSLIKTN